MDMSQYLEIFIEESKEHLQEMNEILLVLEKDFSNTNLLNDIFRVAHTIKGMSGTMGFDKVAKLTHEMENLLHLCRSNAMSVNGTIIDILFECFDGLEEYIENLANSGVEGDRDTSDLVNRLRQIVKDKNTSSIDNAKNGLAVTEQSVAKASAPEPQKHDNADNKKNLFNISLESIPASLIMDAQAAEMSAFMVRVDLDESCVLKAARAFIVFNTLEKLGEVIKSHPSVEDIEDEKFDFSFELVFITKLDESALKYELSSLTDVKNVEIHKIQESDLNVSASYSTTAEVIVDITENTVEEVTNTASVVSNTNTVSQPSASKDKQNKEADKASKGSKHVRVDIDRLDELMNLVSELIIIKTTLDDSNTLGSRQNMYAAIEYLERITTSLHDAVMKVRMVPVEHTFNRFPRMVRDLSKELDKPIRLEMSGEETEIDRTVIDEIGDPLIHLIRNSIDHGIESRAVRKERGKDEEGVVQLKAYPDGNTVVIEVDDDGNGIDPIKIAKKAVEKGLVTQDIIDTMSDNEIIHLLFAPGFSTAEKVTDLSGRGVGLDVVRSKIELLSGTVEVVSEYTKGSKFIIRLPLTLAIIQALMVNVGDEKYAIPLNNIKIITNIEKSKISKVQNQEVVLYRNASLPIIRLSSALDVKEVDNDKNNMTIVVVKKGTREAGLVVDGLIGQQEIVIKSLGKYLGNVKYISGATILGNGGVALIIDPNALF